MSMFVLPILTITLKPTFKNERVINVESYRGLSTYLFLRSPVSSHALELVRQLGNVWTTVTTYNCTHVSALEFQLE